MVSIETLTIFLGWSTVINICLLGIMTIFLVALRGPISQIHSKLCGLNEEDLARAYFQFLAQYKILVIVFNLVPYIALKMMA